MIPQYLHIGSHRDLTGRDRTIYRLFEILPGALSWVTLLGAIFFSWAWPVGVAVFIILFDVYWLIKTFYLSLHLRANWRRLRHNIETDWEKRLENLKWQDLWQLIILPAYKEPLDVVAGSIEAILSAKWPKERMIFVLALEERAGDHAKNLG